MERVSEAVGIFFAAVMFAAVGFEIARRRKRLREVYDVLDSETKQLAIQLEQMVKDAVLTPYTDDTL